MKTKLACLGLLVCAACVTAGCGNPDGIAQLEGTVTIDGKPAPEGLAITFDPVEKGVRGSSGITDGKGNYHAIYSIHQDGVAIGECVARLTNGIDTAPPKPGKKVKSPYPEKYYLEIKRFTVEPGSNTVDLEITTN